MDQELRSSIIEEIKENKLSKLTYAKIFAFGYFSNTKDGIIYSEKDGLWLKGKDEVSELKLLSCVSKICDAIHTALLEEWEESVFSAVIPDKYLKSGLSKLSAIETIDFAKEVINIAKGLMGKADDMTWEEGSENDLPQE